MGSNFASHSGSSASFTSACLHRSIIGGIPKGRRSALPGLGIQTRRTGVARLMSPVLGVNVRGHDQTRLGFDGFHSVYSCGLFALVLLRHPPHCQQPCCFRFQQQLLECVDCTSVATLTGLIDSLLHAETMLISLAPGQLVPSLTRRGRRPLFPGCFPL